MNCDRDNTWDSLSPLGLTNTAGLAEEVSEVGLLPEPLGVSLPQHIISALDLIRHIVNGGDKRIWRRMTKTPETDNGAWRRDRDRDGHRVSRFGVRPRAVSWLSVLTLSLGSSDDDRSLAPFFPLSPLLFLLSDAALILKKARSSALSSSLARE